VFLFAAMSDTTDVRPLVEEAIALAGSEKKLGDLTGYSQNAIWDAKRRGRVTGEMAARIDRATAGAVPKWKLRPDLFDAPVQSVEPMSMCPHCGEATAGKTACGYGDCPAGLQVRAAQDNAA